MSGWGPIVRRRRTDPEIQRRRVLEEQFLAEHAQLQRADAETFGYREETARFFGLGEFAGTGAEQLLTRHGSASAYATCTVGERGGRCEACRAYQAARVARNRAARGARAMCTRTRSSYDAGCRCAGCVAANSTGCRRWRARRVDDDVCAVAA